MIFRSNSMTLEHCWLCRRENRQRWKRRNTRWEDGEEEECMKYIHGYNNRAFCCNFIQHLLQNMILVTLCLMSLMWMWSCDGDDFSSVLVVDFLFLLLIDFLIFLDRNRCFLTPSCSPHSSHFPLPTSRPYSSTFFSPKARWRKVFYSQKSIWKTQKSPTRHKCKEIIISIGFQCEKNKIK